MNPANRPPNSQTPKPVAPRSQDLCVIGSTLSDQYVCVAQARSIIEIFAWISAVPIPGFSLAYSALARPTSANTVFAPLQKLMIA